MNRKTFLLIFILLSLIIFNSIFSFSLDSETIIIGGGDTESLLDYIGDEELVFAGGSNNAPTISSAILNSTLGTNKTTENLTVYFSGVSDPDSDAVTNITDWRKDGQSIAVLNMPFDSNIVSTASGAVRDYSTFGNNGTLGGGTSANAPTWTSDGKVGGAYSFDGVDDYVDAGDLDINNDEMTISAWMKRKAVGVNNGYVVSKRIAGSEDSYQLAVSGSNWLQFEVWIGGVRKTATSSASITNVDEWYYVVGVYNSTNLLTYIDGVLDTNAPSVTGNVDATIDPVHIGRAYSSAFSMNGSIDEVQIYNYSLSPEQINANYQAGLAGHSPEIMVSNETTKGDVWQVAVTPNDAVRDGTTVLSNELTIENTLPTVTLVAPDDENTTTNRTPTFNWTGSDDDNDSLEYEINITLIGASLCTDPDRGAIGISDENYTVPTYLNCLYDNGDYYNWSVRASDDGGSTYGAWSSVRRININSDIVINLTVDAINFGSFITGTNDTSDNVPAPFVIQNDGNCYVNITTNATNLWTVSNPSDYFKYKIDNKSGEEGAFNWLQSQINWQQIPSTDELSIVKLNWSDLVDSAEIDLNITVPPQEVAGNKESTVYFTASLGE